MAISYRRGYARLRQLWALLVRPSVWEEAPEFRDSLIQVMYAGLRWGGGTVLVGVVAHIGINYVTLDRSLTWTYSATSAGQEIALASNVLIAVAGGALMLLPSTGCSLRIGRLAATVGAIVASGASMHDDLLHGNPVSEEFVIMIFLVAVMSVPFRPWQAFGTGSGILGLYALMTGGGLFVPEEAARTAEMSGEVTILGMAVLLGTAVSTVLYATRLAQHRVRRDAQEALEESRDLLQRTQEVAQVGGWEYDPATDTMQGTTEFYRICGISADADLDLEAVVNVFAPDAQATVREAMNRCLDEGPPFDHEVPLTTADGRRRWVRVRGEAREDGSGAGRGADARRLTGILQDVTERRRLEAQLRQAQKMETVGTLAGGVAHDFNNILHAATAHLELAMDQLTRGSSPHSFLENTKSGLEQAEDLANKLLTFSRPESTATRKRIEMASLVQRVIDLAGASLPEHVTLITQLSDECVVIGDRDQLRQVVLNVVTNAIEAMSETSSKEDDVLEICLDSVQVDPDMAEQYLSLTPGMYVHLAVSDTGPGMEEDTRKRAFDPFFTTGAPFATDVASTRKASDKGTGLGLSVAYRAVKAHDGDITIHTQVGEGTTVDVYLPAADSADDGGEAHEKETSTGKATVDERSPRVLVVDDEASVRNLEELRLPRLGYRAETYPGPEAALKAMKEEDGAYDLLLTDYLMPGMTGVELAERLHEAGFSLPVVLMTGYGAQVSKDEIDESGVSVLLRKPVDTHELEDALAQVLQDW